MLSQEPLRCSEEHTLPGQIGVEFVAEDMTVEGEHAAGKPLRGALGGAGGERFCQ